MSRDELLLTVDLPLLMALQQLLETRSVTDAARRCGTSQPSMSRTLTRLRRLFDDRLLVRVGRRLEPTAVARSLAPRVDDAITAVRRVFVPVEPFDPGRERFSFTVAASDYAVVAVLLPQLAQLREQAPGLSLRIVPARAQTVGELARGEIELALGPRAPIEGIEALVMRPVLQDTLVCALRPGHPAAGLPLTLERYLALEHVVVGTDRPQPSAVHLALHRGGHTRKVALVVPSFLAAAAVVASTDLVAALPSQVLARCGHPLVCRPLPVELEPLELCVAWHPRWSSDPRHRWLRERWL
jgi:DNA-binding transcriptional LysR family regulator